jgi:hypothetical protein
MVFLRGGEFSNTYSKVEEKEMHRIKAEVLSE